MDYFFAVMTQDINVVLIELYSMLAFIDQKAKIDC